MRQIHFTIETNTVEISGVAILGSGLVFLLDWGYDTHQTKIIEIHVSKATYINKDYTYSWLVDFDVLFSRLACIVLFLFFLLSILSIAKKWPDNNLREAKHKKVMFPWTFPLPSILLRMASQIDVEDVEDKSRNGPKHVYL